MSKKFSTGNALFELSKKILRTTDVAHAARPHLARLMEAVDETVFLGVREEDVVKALDVEPQKDFRISSQIGTTFAITAGVIGKISLSSMDNREVAELLSQKGLPKYTDASIVDIDAYLREIEKTREQGYAIDLEVRSERDEGRCGSHSLRPLSCRRHLGRGLHLVNERREAAAHHLKP